MKTLITLSLLLVALILPTAAQATTNSCVLSGDRVILTNTVSIQSAVLTDPTFLREPDAWSGIGTFWEGYESATPFAVPTEAVRTFRAFYYSGSEIVSMIWIDTTASTAYVWMFDARGKEADGVWHGCGALTIDLRGDVTPLAWFERGLGG